MAPGRLSALYPSRSAYQQSYAASADKTKVIYRFRVDYEYRAFGKPEKDSRLSQDYRLDIIDK